MSNEMSSSSPAPAPLIPSLNKEDEQDDYRYKYVYNNKYTNLRSSYTQPQIGYHHQIYHDTLQKDIITKQPFLYDCSDQNIPSAGIEIGHEMNVYFDQTEQHTFITELMRTFLQRNPQFGGVNGDFGGMGGVELIFPNNQNNEDDDDDIQPTFIYLNGFNKLEKKNEERGEDHPCAKDRIGQIAYKVKVKECILYPDNTGHVSFIPVSHVKIKSIFERDPASTTTKDNDENDDDNNHKGVIIYDARVMDIKKKPVVERRPSSASVILDATVKKGRSIVFGLGLVFKAVLCVTSSLVLINICCILNLILTSGEPIFRFIFNLGFGNGITHAVYEK